MLLTSPAFIFKIVGILCLLSVCTIAFFYFAHEAYAWFKRYRSRKRATVRTMKVEGAEAVEILN